MSKLCLDCCYYHTPVSDFPCNGCLRSYGKPHFVAAPGREFVPKEIHPKAIKHDDGKPRLDLLDAFAMEQMGLVLAYGAKKYDDAHNWRKGLGYCRLIAAALRHIFAFLRGEDLDPETHLPHPAHAMCCLMFLLAMTKIHPEMDDRWKA